MNENKRILEPIKSTFSIKPAQNQVGEFETVHKEEIEYVENQNRQIKDDTLTYSSLGSVTGILGGSAIATLENPGVGGALALAGAASGVGGRMIAKYIEDVDEVTEQFNFERSQKNYSQLLEDSDKVGVNYLREFREPDWKQPFELLTVTNDYVEPGKIKRGTEARKLYQEITEAIEPQNIKQYLSIQDQEDQLRYDIQLYADEGPLAGFTGYTDNETEYFMD